MHRTAVQIRRGFFIGRYYIPGDGGEGNGTKSATRSDNCGNNKAIVGGALPYLTILEHTSSIYTLMSFLSILNPAKPLSSAVEQHPKQHTTSSKDGRILSAAARAISSVLVTNPARDDDKCVGTIGPPRGRRRRRHRSTGRWWRCRFYGIIVVALDFAVV